MDIVNIRQNLAHKVATIAPIGNTLKFLLSGDIMTVDGRGLQNRVTSEDVDADCTIVMKKETYMKLDRKEMNYVLAAMTGKIKIKGNVGVAVKLRALG